MSKLYSASDQSGALVFADPDKEPSPVRILPGGNTLSVCIVEQLSKSLIWGEEPMTASGGNLIGSEVI